MGINKETKQYLDEMKKEIMGIVNKNIHKCHVDMVQRLVRLEANLEHKSSQLVRKKCNEFCENQVSLFRSLEKSMDFYSDLTDSLASNSFSAATQKGVCELKMERQIEGHHVVNELKQIGEKVNNLEDKFDRSASIQEENLVKIENRFKKFHNENEDRKGDLVKVHNKIDEQKQYNGRNILKLEGIPQRPDENTNVIALDIFHKMGISVSLHDIDRSHRTKLRNGRKNIPSPIYVKFIRHDVRDIVYKNRDILRKMNGFRKVFINEYLTPYRNRIYRSVRKQKDWVSWTYDGTIYVQALHMPKSKIYSITNDFDFFTVFQRKVTKKSNVSKNSFYLPFVPYLDKEFGVLLLVIYIFFSQRTWP